MYPASKHHHYCPLLYSVVVVAFASLEFSLVYPWHVPCTTYSRHTPTAFEQKVGQIRSAGWTLAVNTIHASGYVAVLGFMRVHGKLKREQSFAGFQLAEHALSTMSTEGANAAAQRFCAGERTVAATETAECGMIRNWCPASSGPVPSAETEGRKQAHASSSDIPGLPGAAE